MTNGSTQPDVHVHAAPTGSGKRIALLVIAALGVTLCAARPAVAPVPAGMVQLFGAALCVYATIVALAWYPIPWLSRRLEQAFEHVLQAKQTGWYLVVALASFARAEVSSVLAYRESEFSPQQAALGFLKEYLTGFSLDSLMNAIWAPLWPMGMMQRHGLGPTAIFALVVYGLYALGARTLGEARIEIADTRPASNGQSDPPPQDGK